MNVLEARNSLSKLIAAAQAGEEVLIKRRGKPVARLVAVDPEESETFTGRTFVDWLEINSDLRGTLSREEIDSYVAGERATWA